MPPVRLALATALLVLSAAPAAAAAADVIGVRQGRVHALGPFVVGRDATLGAAQRVFGVPGFVQTMGTTSCRARWRRRGIEVLFVNLGGGRGACRPRLFRAQTYRATAPRWRTQRGLRVRDGVRRLRRLYPHARVRRGRAVLRSARSPFGRGRTPLVVAEVRGGRVRAFRGYVGAAGE